MVTVSTVFGSHILPIWLTAEFFIIRVDLKVGDTLSTEQAEVLSVYVTKGGWIVQTRENGNSLFLP